MFHPTRGGTRGGKDQFKWDDVKADEHRENYIGHSVMAPVGRWQKGKDLTWYAKGKISTEEQEALRRQELQKIKEEEEILMQEALGLKPKRENTFVVGSSAGALERADTDQLFKRRGKEEKEETLGKGERVQGIGFAPAPRALMAASVAAKPMAGKEEVEKPVSAGQSSDSASASGSDSKKGRNGSEEGRVGGREAEAPERTRKPGHLKREERKARKELVSQKVKEGRKAEKRRKREERKERKQARREERKKSEGSSKARHDTDSD